MQTTIRRRPLRKGLLMHLKHNIKNRPHLNGKKKHKEIKKCEQGCGGVRTQKKNENSTRNPGNLFWFSPV